MPLAWIIEASKSGGVFLSPYNFTWCSNEENDVSSRYIIQKVEVVIFTFRIFRLWHTVWGCFGRAWHMIACQRSVEHKSIQFNSIQHSAYASAQAYPLVRLVFRRNSCYSSCFAGAPMIERCAMFFGSVLARVMCVFACWTF